MRFSTPLPIDAVLPDVRATLDNYTRLVLEAPPGAGKTTRVPLALLDALWLGGQKIVMLEPRRLAARAAAHRMAQTLGERIGETVGYRVRMEAKVGRNTRIEVVTEGILTRLLQDDPELRTIGALLFDEYHERSLTADLGLALALDVQHALRPDLRVVLMSATLDARRVAAWLDAPLVRSEGRLFPVETHFLDARASAGEDRHPAQRLERLVPPAVREALEKHAGDVLVFLPGVGEIKRVEEKLKSGALPAAVHPLYGDLPLDAQDAAIAPARPGTRKVVLATSIAETSLTIEGVRVVIDGGFSRVPRFSPRTGLTTLATVAVSQAAADQRRGRAGRLAPGVCYRLWTRADDARHPSADTPEILDADLSALALELALWGVRDADALRWLDAPPGAAMAQARDLLHNLGALDAAGGVTPHGRAMAGLGVAPRLAHVLARGKSLGLGPTACALVALLAERDVLRGPDRFAPPDLRLRLEKLAGGRPLTGAARFDGQALKRVEHVARHLARRLGVASSPTEPGATGRLTALAYPERIAQRETDTRFRMATGQRVALDEHSPLAAAPFLAVAHLAGPGHAPRIALAAPLDADDLMLDHSDRLAEAESVEWDATAGRVVARRQKTLDALVLADAPLAEPDPEKVLDAFLVGLMADGLDALPWSKDARRVQARMGFLHHLDPQTHPDVSDDVLAADLAWLRPYLYGMKKRADLARLSLLDVLFGLPGAPSRADLDTLAPSHVDVPSGSRIPLDYADPEAPVLAVRLQEVFGLLDTPRVGGGRVPVVMHLLSPAGRPAQVTRDLASFWRDGYFDVRKDLRGRYPKHPWPENPLDATPTNRAKRR